jgi:hypothetical protein
MCNGCKEKIINLILISLVKPLQNEPSSIHIHDFQTK